MFDIKRIEFISEIAYRHKDFERAFNVEIIDTFEGSKADADAYAKELEAEEMTKYEDLNQWQTPLITYEAKLKF